MFCIGQGHLCLVYVKVICILYRSRSSVTCIGQGHLDQDYSGFPPYLKNLENLEFCPFFSRAGKCLEFAQKVVKTWNFNTKPEKILKFTNSIFGASLFKMSFTKIILIYFFVISTLSTQTLIRIETDLGFHCFYLEITWKIHGILCHKRSGNPTSVLTHFKIFFFN